MDEMSPQMQSVLKKIQGLLNLAAKNTNEAEAASAAAKANELMEAYNLTSAELERSTGKAEGKREDAKVDGGFYKYQRDLWQAVAELHFCMYWTQEYVTVRDTTIVRRGVTYAKGDRVLRKQHRLVGRMVNVAATRALVTYLEGAIDKLLREKLGGDNLGQLYGGWGITFRQGAAERLCEKIYARRRHLLAEEERRKRDAEVKANEAGAPVGASNAVTLAGYTDSETDANYDFLHGEGASARKRAKEAEWKKENAKWRAQQAKVKAREEVAYAEWAAANPEEVARLAKEEERKERKRQYNADRRGGWGRPEARDKTNYEAFYAGRAAGDAVSLDDQVGSRSSSQKRLK